MLFEHFRQGYHWFSVCEISHVLLLAVVASWKPTEFAPCMARNVFITSILLLGTLIILILRPHSSTIDYTVAILTYGGMTIAVLLMTISIGLKADAADDTVHKLSVIAGWLLFTLAILQGIKGAFDLCLYVADLLVIHRRKTAQVASRTVNVAAWKAATGKQAAIEEIWDSQDSPYAAGSLSNGQSSPEACMDHEDTELPVMYTRVTSAVLSGLDVTGMTATASSNKGSQRPLWVHPLRSGDRTDSFSTQGVPLTPVSKSPMSEASYKPRFGLCISPKGVRSSDRQQRLLLPASVCL
ncbi:hypothetical protein DIPPA_02125 [Diplonema papillatum]|nr:hypothetical protein DIPPA_02125 [Diplonema papillatum]